ncbi:efflux RND transporter periplasmic adaptor subunit [Lysobacter sp. ISL-50]|uniref:efflux RND transporter periplasmic adaptor subunit n=1 Tax=unclassified Lysobacter TaxID=2635362 RepID=UPI001BE8024F|nr:efflux RND transporter periplasmic adaptor subunit [Lysobacter sp. ISL-42]MBT2753476.1 efflux RND transporter periplasmic adaptor subunit [Lysobacter sp. ISL-50]MBT2777140.1 efflux RND transporter periplasmic adaptor subunit [Lysobacter sp. ISL-54]MBT2780234.1 efflux RND transporter periplasmic adaptor subunit [Lysobacter sp. ISL-52]
MRSSVSNAMALAAGCALALVLPACGESRSQEDGSKPPQQVGVVTLVDAPLVLTQELPGRTRAMQVADIRPQVSGIVKKRLFVEGEFVQAGQALYQLDDAVYRASFDSAQANLRKAEVTAHAAQLAAKRSRELNKIHAVSEQDNESAVMAADQAQAEVGVARATLQSARVNLAYANIVAPISGRIGKSNVTEGSLVTANQDEPLALVQKLDPIYVDVNQPSANWLALKQAIDSGRLQSSDAGAAVSIQLENGAAYAHEGKLQFSDVTVDPTTGNFLLRAVVPNPKLTLLPGMYVRAIVKEGTLADALLAPQQAVTLDADGKASAWVVDKDNKVKLRSVRVSRTVGDQWLVEDGLKAGERVIVEGGQKVEPDMLVQAVPASKPAPAASAGR